MRVTSYHGDLWYWLRYLVLRHLPHKEFLITLPHTDNFTTIPQTTSVWARDRGGFLKIISVGIPTYAGVKTGF